MNLICRWRGHNWGEPEERYWPQPWYLNFALLMHGRSEPRAGTVRLRARARICERCKALDAEMLPSQWYEDGRWQTWDELHPPPRCGDGSGFICPGHAGYNGWFCDGEPE